MQHLDSLQVAVAATIDILVIPSVIGMISQSTLQVQRAKKELELSSNLE